MEIIVIKVRKYIDTNLARLLFFKERFSIQTEGVNCSIFIKYSE